MNTPAYWNPTYFAKGESVSYGEFEAAVEGHYAEGMWNIRLPGGSACVSGASLKRKPVIWKPSKAECELIKRAALLESEGDVKAVKLEPGIRYNRVHTHAKPQCINIARVTAMTDGTWEDTDLSDHSTWMGFKKGVELSEDGKAIVDFYIYSSRGVDHLGLLGNVYAIYENGKLASVRGGHGMGVDYLPQLSRN